MFFVVVVEGVAVPNGVAFHTSLQTGKHYTINEIIKYDVIHLDTENGFNKLTGEYIAPKTGVYVFSWKTILNGDTHKYSTRLMVNGSPEGYQWVQAGSGDTDPSATDVVVLDITSGDEIYIQVHASVGDIFSHEDYGTTTFSGWMIA